MCTDIFDFDFYNGGRTLLFVTVLVHLLAQNIKYTHGVGMVLVLVASS